MKYVGGKAQLVREILPIILKDREVNECYIEPFLGGAWVASSVANPRLLSDIDKPLIALWQGLLEGRRGPSITKDQYMYIKANRDLIKDQFYLGWFGYCFSYYGLYFSGYDNCNVTDGRLGDLSAGRFLGKIEGLAGAKIVNSCYSELKLPDPPAIIYCDPPYDSVYSYSKRFDSDKFWNWVREKSRSGYKVFVSESRGPEDFKILWEREVKLRIGNFKNKTSGRRVERLFVYEG